TTSSAYLTETVARKSRRNPCTACAATVVGCPAPRALPRGGFLCVTAGWLHAACSCSRAAPSPSRRRPRAFRSLPGLADLGANFEATHVSADGAVIVGKYFLAGLDPRCGVFGGCTRAFIWTAATGA